MKLGIIDTHAHLNDKRFNEDWCAMRTRAEAQGVVASVLPNVEEETILPILGLLQEQSDWCFGMLGLHPCSVQQNWQEQIAQLWKYESAANWIAVGEIGLDLYWDKTTLERQLMALHVQFQKAQQMGLPICLHTRNAHAETVSALKEFRPDAGGVFHCFSGNYFEAVQVFDLDMFIGIGGVVTYKLTELREVLSKVGLSRVVLETDSPYLPPVPYRGKRNEPAYLSEVVQVIAQACSCHPQEVIETTFENALRVYPKLSA